MRSLTPRRGNEPDKTRESAWYARGFRYVAGIDEAGRGPLAGPVTAACVMFAPDKVISGVRDSKMLSAAMRECLYERITGECMAWAVVSVSVEDIEKFNILQATKKAMTEAALQLFPRPEVLLVDAVALDGADMEQEAIIGGDRVCFSIAAASILAKVTRDRYMTELDHHYPQYGFARHKGYGTAEHADAIRRYGPCPAHRRLFLRSILGKDENS